LRERWNNDLQDDGTILRQAKAVLDSVYKAHSQSRLLNFFLATNESELIEVLNLTYDVLCNPSSEQLQAYEGLANRVTDGRQPDPVAKGLGQAMIALGATFAVMSLLTVIPAVSIALGIAALSTILAISTFALSAGFFAGGGFAIQKGRRSGLSKSVKDFEQAVDDDLSNQCPMDY